MEYLCASATSLVFFLQLHHAGQSQNLVTEPKISCARREAGMFIRLSSTGVSLSQSLFASLHQMTLLRLQTFKRKNFVFASQNGGQESILAKVREFVGTRYLKMAEWLLSAARSVTTILDIQ